MENRLRLKSDNGEHLAKRNHYCFILLLIFTLPFIITNSNFSIQEAKESTHTESPLPALPNLATGDLIFRKSESLTGQFVNIMDTQSEFSHVGIIRLSDENEVRIIHASPQGEETQSMVQVATLEYFLSYSHEIAIYRPKSAYKKIAIQAANYAFSLAGIMPFDRGFDLETEDEVYCTELIWRVFLEAGLDIVENHFDELEMPLFGGNEYIFPSTLMNEKYFYQFYP